MHSYEQARPSASPRLDSQVELTDGRVLAYTEWGPSDGTPVVFFHGTPGSRLFCPDARGTVGAGVRFISFDRAGYGRSDPDPGRAGYPAYVPDVVELLDRLDVERAVLVGWSGGGPHALATAALAPERVMSIGLASAGLIGPASPMVSDGTAEYRQLIADLGADPVGQRHRAVERSRWLTDDPTELVRLTERFVPDALAADGLLDAMTVLFEEAGRGGLDGYVDDYLTTFAFAPGFDVGSVAAPVTSWAGELDGNLPLAESRRTAAALPSCELVVCRACGHFTPVAHWVEMLERLC